MSLMLGLASPGLLVSGCRQPFLYPNTEELPVIREELATTFLLAQSRPPTSQRELRVLNSDFEMRK